ncbi:MAG: hypothetical protein ACUVTD_01390 [Nitrososphaerales archaeon]
MGAVVLFKRKILSVNDVLKLQVRATAEATSACRRARLRIRRVD